MGDALGDLARGHHLHDLRRVAAARVDERQLLGDRGAAPLHVRGGGLVQEPQAVHGVVETRDHRLERRRGQVGEVVLEGREGAGRDRRVLRVGDEVDRGVALEEAVDAPRVLVADDLERLHSLGLQVGGHAQDVLLEDVLVEDVGDALEDVPRPSGGLHLEGVVDVPRAVARDVGRVVDAEADERRPELLLRVLPVGHVELFLSFMISRPGGGRT